MHRERPSNARNVTLKLKSYVVTFYTQLAARKSTNSLTFKSA